MVLQTIVSGNKPSPEQEHWQRFADELATGIVKVHRLDSPDARSVALPYKRYYEVDRLHVPDWATQPPVWMEAIKIAALPEPPGRQCFIHRDYHHGNTMWDKGQLTGIIDWDRGSWGSPAIDLARARQNLVIEYGAGLADSFTRSYRELTGDALKDLAYWDIVDILDGTPDELFTGPDGAARILRLETHLRVALADFGWA
jgi:aminoglycoside phosphotransferase (APT) family kinase protein